MRILALCKTFLQHQNSFVDNQSLAENVQWQTFAHLNHMIPSINLVFPSLCFLSRKVTAVHPPALCFYILCLSTLIALYSSPDKIKDYVDLLAKSFCNESNFEARKAVLSGS